MGSPFSFTRKRPFIFLKRLSFSENLPSCERASANHVCAESMRNAVEWNQLNLMKLINEMGSGGGGGGGGGESEGIP